MLVLPLICYAIFCSPTGRAAGLLQHSQKLTGIT